MQKKNKKQNLKYKLITLIFCTFTSIPFLFSLKYGLYDLNGLQWSMTWNNEVTIWGLIFITFSIFGILYYYYANEKQIDKYFYVLLLYSFILITPYFYNFLKCGLGPSSQADSSQIQLIGFWLEGCFGKFPN